MPSSSDARQGLTELRRGESPDEEDYLQTIGQRVRLLRTRRGMSRRELAQVSGVSERYLADLEHGAGNASLLVIRQLATAMGSSVQDLVTDRPAASVDVALLRHQIDRLSPGEARELRAHVSRRFGRPFTPEHRIALIGLRGAGKTTLGRAAAEAIGFPFVELNREIERAGGRSLADVFASEGQAGFRRREIAALEAVVRANDRAVIATGGSIVTEPHSFDLLLATCHVVWLKAEPEDHIRRVAAQGDWRPIQASRDAMNDARAILGSRAALYGQAHAVMDTSGVTVADAAARLTAIIRDRLAETDIAAG